MARTAEQIQAQIDAIAAAIGSGVLRTRHGDTEVMYQSLSDMLKAKAALEAEIADVNSTSVKQVRFMTSKGLC